MDTKMEIEKVQVTGGALAKCSEFLASPLLRQACKPVVYSYFQALQALIAKEGSHLGAVETKYTLSDNTFVCFYDLKCNSHFEDPIIERFYKEWPSSPAALKFGPVCPFRRGLCFGLINDSVLILSIGNIKFFYGEDDTQILENQNFQDVLLSEKANGEYTMISSTTQPISKQRWLTFGSKNVRIALPYNELAPMETLKLMDSFILKYNTGKSSTRQQSEESGGGRYHFIKDMIPLWLDLLTPIVLSQLDTGMTLLGEQVGVHAHIFDGYARPHIRIFGAIPWATLTVSKGCDLRQLDRVFSSSAPVVDYTVFRLPIQKQLLGEKLLEIASGPMDVHGEGVVVYGYNKFGQCHEIFKYKCQEYAFDRRLRTLLSKLAADLSSSTQVSKQRLFQEASRIGKELKKSFHSQFSKMNAARAQERIATVPAFVAFLERHSNTLYCSDFHDQFVSFLNATMTKRNDYLRLSSEFMIEESVDEDLDAEFDVFLTRYASLTVPFRSIDDLSLEMYYRWCQSKEHIVGISSPPGGGKTSLLQHLRDILLQEGISCAVCDRDSYVLQSNGKSSGEEIHRIWMMDCEKNLQLGNVILVGNTFSSTFADKLEKTLKTSMLLFSFEEGRHSVLDKKQKKKNPTQLKNEWLFHLECLRRLSKRQEEASDLSTLNMSLGSKVVLNKYFTSQPDATMLSKRLANHSSVIIHALFEGNQNVPMEFISDLTLLATKATTVKPAPTPSKSNEAPIIRTKRPSYISSPNPTGKPLFIGLAPDVLTSRRFLSLADADLIRTDCHLTLVYQPTPEQIDEIASSSLAYHGWITLHTSALVTVTKDMATRNAPTRLQFVWIQPFEFVDVQISQPAHVTLGSTNLDLLPSVTSGKVIQMLLKRKLEVTSRSPVALENDLFAWIYPLEETFVGILTFYHSAASSHKGNTSPSSPKPSTPSNNNSTPTSAGKSTVSKTPEKPSSTKKSNPPTSPAPSMISLSNTISSNNSDRKSNKPPKTETTPTQIVDLNYSTPLVPITKTTSFIINHVNSTQVEFIIVGAQLTTIQLLSKVFPIYSNEKSCQLTLMLPPSNDYSLVFDDLMSKYGLLPLALVTVRVRITSNPDDDTQLMQFVVLDSNPLTLDYPVAIIKSTDMLKLPYYICRRILHQLGENFEQTDEKKIELENGESVWVWVSSPSYPMVIRQF